MKSLILCAALLMTGCSEMPTAPSSNPSPPTPPPSSSTTLRWDIAAPGCTPAPPPSPLPDPSEAQLTPGREGVIVATWRRELPSGAQGLLIARFVESGGMLLLCSWDTSDL